MWDDVTAIVRFWMNVFWIKNIIPNTISVALLKETENYCLFIESVNLVLFFTSLCCVRSTSGLSQPGSTIQYIVFHWWQHFSSVSKRKIIKCLKMPVVEFWNLYGENPKRIIRIFAPHSQNVSHEWINEQISLLKVAYWSFLEWKKALNQT